MPSTAFNYEIVEKIAVLSQSGERELFQKICNEFTSALRQFVGEAPTRTQKDPLQLVDEATKIFNQQAEETQQELQRMADEAQDAINKGAGL